MVCAVDIGFKFVMLISQHSTCKDSQFSDGPCHTTQAPIMSLPDNVMTRGTQSLSEPQDLHPVASREHCSILSWLA